MDKLHYKSSSPTIYLKIIKMENLGYMLLLSQEKYFLKCILFIEIKILDQTISHYQVLVLNHVINMTSYILF
jgi:hypothetical protein